MKSGLKLVSGIVNFFQFIIFEIPIVSLELYDTLHTASLVTVSTTKTCWIVEVPTTFENIGKSSLNENGASYKKDIEITFW